MFEKDAEKYGKENCVIQKNGLCTFVDSERTSKIWKDGAEFGYNKANEWHYPSKGELPTRDCMVLLHWESAIGSNTVITYWKKGKFLQPYNRKDITVAWQEIIPPKESE